MSTKYKNINFRTIPANFSFAPLFSYVLWKMKRGGECNGRIGHARIWHISVGRSEWPEAHFRILPNEWTFFTTLYYSSTILSVRFIIRFGSSFLFLILPFPLLSLSICLRFFTLYFAHKQRLFPRAASVFAELM